MRMPPTTDKKSAAISGYALFLIRPLIHGQKYDLCLAIAPGKLALPFEDRLYAVELPNAYDRRMAPLVDRALKAVIPGI